MEDRAFFKKLNIIYVEDDDILREETSNSLSFLVKKLYVAKDGCGALELYETLIHKNIKIDAVISDINMPSMDGVELLKTIRNKNSDLPFIFTTAYTEKEYLLDAIKFNATAYIVKPIDIRKLLSKLSEVCHTYHQLDTIKKQKKELERYLSAIDNVAIVSKTDIKGNITFANEIFCQIAQYTREELYNNSHNMVRHPDMPKAAFKDLWTTIKNGDTWQGKVKNRAKDGTAYYVNATIIPIFDDFGEDIIEFVGIRFLTTDDEIEKREFKKKVLQNIQDSKRKELDNIRKIKLLEEQLLNYTHIDISSINREILLLNEKNEKLNSQIKHYESELKLIKEKNSSLTSLANEKVKKASTIAIHLKKQNEKVEKENNSLKEELKLKQEAILDFEKRVKEKNKHIENLQDVIKFKEKELSNNPI